MKNLQTRIEEKNGVTSLEAVDFLTSSIFNISNETEDYAYKMNYFLSQYNSKNNQLDENIMMTNEEVQDFLVGDFPVKVVAMIKLNDDDAKKCNLKDTILFIFKRLDVENEFISFIVDNALEDNLLHNLISTLKCKDDITNVFSRDVVIRLRYVASQTNDRNTIVVKDIIPSESSKRYIVTNKDVHEWFLPTCYHCICHYNQKVEKENLLNDKELTFMKSFVTTYVSAVTNTSKDVLAKAFTIDYSTFS